MRSTDNSSAELPNPALRPSTNVDIMTSRKRPIQRFQHPNHLSATSISAVQVFPSFFYSPMPMLVPGYDVAWLTASGTGGQARPTLPDTTAANMTRHHPTAWWTSRCASPSTQWGSASSQAAPSLLSKSTVQLPAMLLAPPSSSVASAPASQGTGYEQTQGPTDVTSELIPPTRA
jgi:hypothetical protein